MDQIIYYICIPLGVLMKWCWQLASNYGLAIILFTLATKVVLLPLTVWIHKNSILMVKIQPEMNFLKAKYYHDSQTLAGEQSKLFKRAKYHPMLTMVPLILQIVLLLGVVFIINRPLTYLFGMAEGDILRLASEAGMNLESSSFELSLIQAIREGKYVLPGEFDWLYDTLSGFDSYFAGFELTLVATEVRGLYLLVPLLAAVSSWLLCFSQNAANVLQHEQGNGNKYGTMAFSVALSLYLGCFVPAGTVLYWVAGNVFSVLQLLLLNLAINPKKYVDYGALEESRRALARIEADENTKEEKKKKKALQKRERRDYRRFFGTVNKHLVIYSEKSGFYKYFKGLIEELLSRSNITIHYITNDPDDVIFQAAEKEPRIQAYYIGLTKLISLMLKLEADMVVMTTPDLDKYYLKKSIMRRDVEYVYLPHDLMSIHMGAKEGALDAFDTVFCTGEHIKREVRATERVYALPPKDLFEFGYPLVEDLITLGEAEKKVHKTGGRKEILIAPTWNEDNILDSCIDPMLEGLLCEDYHITVRPHPEYVKRFGDRMNETVDRWKDKIGEGLTFELDFSSNKSIYSSDLMITDWSGISFEFSFATKRPTLFINTKMKVLNPNWQRIECEPIEITMRNEIGVSIEKSDVGRIGEVVSDLLGRPDEYSARIGRVLHQTVYNIGKSNALGAEYLLDKLLAKQEARQGK